MLQQQTAFSVKDILEFHAGVGDSGVGGVGDVGGDYYAHYWTPATSSANFNSNLVPLDGVAVKATSATYATLSGVDYDYCFAYAPPTHEQLLLPALPAVSSGGGGGGDDCKAASIGGGVGGVVTSRHVQQLSHLCGVGGAGDDRGGAKRSAAMLNKNGHSKSASGELLLIAFFIT